MPTEAGYEQRTTPQAPAPLPLPTAASEGAAIGAGLSDLGDEVNASQLQLYRAQRQQQADQQAANFDHDFATRRAAMDTVVQSLRDNAPAGAPAHTQNVMAALNGQKDALFDGITDTRVAQHAQAQWDAYSGSLQASESAWENGQRIGKQVTDFTNGNNVSQNRLVTNPDFATYQQETTQRNNAIDAMQGVPDEVKEKLRSTTNNGLATSFIQGTTQKNPNGAMQMLDQGLFDDVLKPEEREVLHRGAEVELRHQTAMAQQQDAHAKAQLNTDIGVVEKNASGGVDVSAAIPPLIARAQALNDPEKVAQLTNLLGEQQFPKIYKDTTPLQRDQREQQLAAEKNPSEADQRELHWLQTHNPEMTAKFNTDPAGTQANLGYTPPPIGPLREQWAATQGKLTGRPATQFVLTDDEAKQLGAYKLNGGIQGSDQALAALDQFSPGPMRAAAARMVAPNDKFFQQLAQVDSDARATIRQGQAAIQGQPHFFGTETTNKPVLDLMTAQDGKLRDALRFMNTEDVNTTVQQARAHLAGTMTAKGITPDKIDTPMYQQSVRMALGGGTTQHGLQVGGLGDWGGHPVVLPTTATNQTFTNATRGWLAGHHPTNANGTPISIDTIWPVAMGNDDYGFLGSDQHFVADKSGKALKMHIIGAPR
jgi:hypothetical protein